MSLQFDVVCLGGGVPGEAIAEGLRESGLTLAVVERELVWGECPYWGCVPSKTLLRSSETLSEADRARLLAASRVDWTIDFAKVSNGAGAALRPHLEADGITPMIGDPCIAGEQQSERPSHERSTITLHLKSGAVARARSSANWCWRSSCRVRCKALADGIHPFPAFKRVLGAALEELAAKEAQGRVPRS